MVPLMKDSNVETITYQYDEVGIPTNPSLREAFELWEENQKMSFYMKGPKPDKEVMINSEIPVFAILKFDEQVFNYYFARIRIGF